MAAASGSGTEDLSPDIPARSREQEHENGEIVRGSAAGQQLSQLVTLPVQCSGVPNPVDYCADRRWRALIIPESAAFDREGAVCVPWQQ